MKYRLGEQRVRCLGEHFIAPGAAVVGEVTLGDGVGVWFNAVLRADNAPIEIGAQSNIQECAVLHVDPGQPLRVGEQVTVGHQAVLHGCRVGDTSLIGIGAVVLNGARIGHHCLVGAQALVTEGAQIPDGSLVLGAPAKVVRALREEEIAALAHSARVYRDKIDQYRRELRLLD